MKRCELLSLIVVIALLLWVVSSAGAQSSVNRNLLPGDSATSATVPPTAPKAVPSEYQIGAGDVLAINVWKEPELSRVLPVRPDGVVSLPLIGEVEASGATAAQLQAALTEDLRKFMENPEVTVMVQEARSRRFNVVGQVQRPGSYVLTQPTTVLDGLALVGGFRDFAKVNKIYVLRMRPDGKTDRLPFHYKKVIQGNQLEQNVELQSTDTIVVP